MIGMTGEIISFKIAFLRAMAPVMTESDLDSFSNVCRHFADGTPVVADLDLLDQLYDKFNKPGRSGENSSIKG